MRRRKSTKPSKRKVVLTEKDQLLIRGKRLFLQDGIYTVPVYFIEDMGDIIIEESNSKIVTVTRAGLGRFNLKLLMEEKKFHNRYESSPMPKIREDPPKKAMRTGSRDVSNPYHSEFVLFSGGWYQGSTMDSLSQRFIMNY